MGASGTAIFSDDTALDVRDEWRDAILDGLGAEEATAKLLQSFDDHLGDEDTEPLFWIALAAAQFETGPKRLRRRPDFAVPFDVGDVVHVYDEGGENEALVVVVGHVEEARDRPPVVAALDWEDDVSLDPTALARLRVVHDHYAPGRQLLIAVMTTSKHDAFGPEVGEVVASGVRPRGRVDPRDVAHFMTWGSVARSVCEAQHWARAR